MTAVPSPSRRAVLAGAFTVALAAATGCTSDSVPSDTVPSDIGPSAGRRTLSVGPQLSRDGADVARVVRAIADEERLLHYCTMMGKRHRSSRTVLRPLATRQRAHIRTLRDILIDSPAEPTTVSPPVPASQKAAFRKLESLLAAARDKRLDDCLAVSSGLLARVLASASASHACTRAAVKGQS